MSSKTLVNNWKEWTDSDIATLKEFATEDVLRDILRRANQQAKRISEISLTKEEFKRVYEISQALKRTPKGVIVQMEQMADLLPVKPYLAAASKKQSETVHVKNEIIEKPIPLVLDEPTFRDYTKIGKVYWKHSAGEIDKMVLYRKNSKASYKIIVTEHDRDKPYGVKFANDNELIDYLDIWVKMNNMDKLGPNTVQFDLMGCPNCVFDMRELSESRRLLDLSKKSEMLETIIHYVDAAWSNNIFIFDINEEE
jgi:hypothetical protein